MTVELSKNATHPNPPSQGMKFLVTEQDSIVDWPPTNAGRLCKKQEVNTVSCTILNLINR